MQNPLTLCRRRSLLGLWFAVWALCALNLQSLQHFQRMLVEDGVCSVGAGDAKGASSETHASRHDAACALSCAQHIQAAAPLTRLPHLAATAARSAFTDPGVLGRPVTRAWSIGQPRGPPQGG